MAGCNELNLVAHGYEDKGRCGGGGQLVVLEMRSDMGSSNGCWVTSTLSSTTKSLVTRQGIIYIPCVRNYNDIRIMTELKIVYV